MNSPENNILGAVLWPVSILLAWMSTVDRSTVTFIAGLTVSICAVLHYIVQIRKNLKK